jgi:hypothetical protein
VSYLVDVLIQWHDGDTPIATKVAIDEPFDPLSEEDDSRVFYYFESEEEFERAKQEGDNGFEFRVIEED